MTEHIAIIGNSGLNIGIFMAGDLALAGEEVAFFLWPDQSETRARVVEGGGIRMEEPADRTLSRRTGLGLPRLVTQDLSAAVDGASLVVMDVAAAELESRFAELAPHLADGQVVHINTHGYWPALRVARQLRSAGKSGVTLTEGISPSAAGGRDGAVVTPHALRRNVLVGAFPAARSDAAMAQLRRIFHSLEPAEDVLQTNLSSMNFLIHPAMSLVNIGYFDRAEEAGDPISFYGTGNTASAARLAEALDAERPAVCEALAVPCRPLLDLVKLLYGGDGDDLRAAIADAPFYRDLPPLPADVWRAWMRIDLPLAQVPFVRLAEQLGVAVPLHRGFVDLMSAMIGLDAWACGLDLETLGLADLSAEEMRRYVHQG